MRTSSKLDGPADATLLVLCAGTPSEQVRSALEASAKRLGHERPPAFAATGSLSPQELRLLVFELDPWSVAALDDASLKTLKAAFKAEAAALVADAPVEACGYTLVAVPDFAECFGNQRLKRIAWGRLKATEHPAPL